MKGFLFAFLSDFNGCPAKWVHCSFEIKIDVKLVARLFFLLPLNMQENGSYIIIALHKTLHDVQEQFTVVPTHEIIY
jgi:hypothetical protein